MKKIMAIILTVTLLFTMAIPMTASAASDDAIIEEAYLDEAIEGAAGALIGASEDAKISVPAALTAEVKTAAEGDDATADDVSGVLVKYLFVNLADVDALSTEIAEDSAYNVKVLDNGKTTVYILVDIAKHPEVLNLDVFRETVKKLDAKQKEVANDENADYDLMSYQHIAGELALHAAVYAVAGAVGGDKEGNALYSYYLAAKEAELNIDESRFPTNGIAFIGSVIMDYIFATFYTIYQLIAG